VVPEGEAIPVGKAHISFDIDHTHIYEDSWLAGDKTRVEQ
jgi:hypothetical protein